MHNFKLFRCLAVVLLLSICTAGSGQPTRMSRDDVVKAANAAAIKAGYKLAQYGVPEVHYELIRKDKTWTISYTR